MKNKADMQRVEIKEIIYYVPDLFADFINSGSSFRFYRSNDISNFNKIFKDIKTCKFIIVENTRNDTVAKLFKEIVKRVDELIPFEELQRINSRSFSKSRKREYDKIKNDILNRILIKTKNDKITSFDENAELPYLISFCGTDPYNIEYGKEFLIPYKFYIELQDSLKNSLTINCLKMNVSSGINVLLPKSQETTELFKTAFENSTDRDSKKIIDMGCGSGVLTLLTNELFTRSEIYFSDILPEALASTIRNIENNNYIKFVNLDNKISCRTKNNLIYCLGSGDLFEKTDDLYDIIIFNPPWIDAECNNRSELALNDKDQKTLERFLMQSKRRLSNNGKVFLAFSDNSGDTAVEKFNKLIEDNEFVIENEFSSKIQSHQSGRKWMKIFVKILKRN